jgi:anaerobic magnesium-protoporphyrin IX monomethyl ester cyclase
MRTILVYPAITLCGFGQRSPSRTNQITFNGEVNWIHHGLALVGTVARKAGFDIDILDMRDLDGWCHFEEIVKKEQWSVIGITVSYIDYKASIKAIDIIKKVSPKSIIVVGGFVPTIFPALFVENENVDYVMIGEGELSFTQLLKDIQNGIVNPKLIPSIRPTLDELPNIDRSLFNYNRETTCFLAPGQPYPHITMIAGRGCPFSCKYCQPAERSVYGAYRIRSVENVINELKEMRDKWRFKSISFWDDTFTLKKSWVMDFCDSFEKEGFKAEIFIYCRADIAAKNSDMIKRMAEIGVKYVCIGFETGSQRMLDFIGKGVKIDQNYKAKEVFEKYGVEVMGSFMLGLPTETKEESLATVDMIKKLDPYHVWLFYFTPIPGTYLYDYCKEHDLILRKDLLNIERVDQYSHNIKGVDYDYLDEIRGTIPMERYCRKVLGALGR